jgi:hypothetical protein
VPVGQADDSCHVLGMICPDDVSLLTVAFAVVVVAGNVVVVVGPAVVVVATAVVVVAIALATATVVAVVAGTPPADAGPDVVAEVVVGDAVGADGVVVDGHVDAVTRAAGVVASSWFWKAGTSSAGSTPCFSRPNGSAGATAAVVTGTAAEIVVGAAFPLAVTTTCFLFTMTTEDGPPETAGKPDAPAALFNPNKVDPVSAAAETTPVTATSTAVVAAASALVRFMSRTLPTAGLEAG